MKNFYLLMLGLCCILASCSKTEPSELPDPDPEQSLLACFEVEKTTVMVGEKLQLTSCSKAASSYSYDFGDGQQSTAKDPEITYPEAGSFTIVLTVKDAGQTTKTFSMQIQVVSAETYYHFPDVPEHFSAIPMETGLHPVSSHLYALMLLEDTQGAGGSKFYFHSLDATYSVTAHYIADKPYNSNAAFVNFLPSGNQNFHFSRTLNGLYGSQEFTYNGAWSFINNINPADKLSYGFLEVGANYLYYGTQEDEGVYKTAIESRNSNGDAFELMLNSFGPSSSMIGDMIPIPGGYAAYGGVFIKNITSPYISGYKPMLVFFNTSLEPVSHIEYEDSALGSRISSPNDLNGPFHLARLSNGNYIMYQQGVFRLTDEAGLTLKSGSYPAASGIQAMVGLEDGFVISTDLYLRKFDLSGNEIKSLKYDGNYLPEILENEGKLYFLAGYDSGETVELFLGACDKNLNLIDVNL